MPDPRTIALIDELRALPAEIAFAARPFAHTTTQERLRACYQQAVLLHLGGRPMRNRELRERFGIKSSNAAQVSDVIRQALDEGLIRIADPARPRSGYVPFWA